MKLLLTTTSFQDTPGKHQELLNAQGYDIDRLRGPLKESELLPIIDKYDAVICGDDEYTEAVIKKGSEAGLKMLSKYGVGLDKIDLKAAEKSGIKVTNCPGVNTRSVAEHVLALILNFNRHIYLEYNITRQGKWKRFIGTEIYEKTLGILGFGNIGKEVALMFKALGLKVKAYDKYMDNEFAEVNGIEVSESVEELLRGTDILSLHVPLTEETDGIISMDLLSETDTKGLLLINTARADLIKYDTVKWALDQEIIRGYCTDVMYEEPMKEDEPLKDLDKVVITPHIGSRTFESVQRQGLMAVNNLLHHLND